MKKLVDQQLSPDSPEGWLAELVRAMPRLEESPFRKERALVDLLRATSLATFAPAMGRPAALRRRVWATAASAAALSTAAAVASVAVREARSPAPGPAPSPVAVVPVLPTPSAGAGANPAPESPPARVEAPPDDAPGGAPPIAPRRAGARAGDGEDPALVLEAIRALRSQGNPPRAAALLADYLQAHPRGVLVEDALALSIEAAIARHDARATAAMSRRYLTQFPGGRYRTFATRATQP